MLNNKIIKELQIDWSKIDEWSYLRKIPSIQSLKKLEFTKNITFFVGENGSGKSTLLEAIAVAYGFNPEGGTINYNFRTYDDVSELHNAVTLTKGIHRAKFGYFFRAESFFNVSTKAEKYKCSYGNKNLHAQSHGESFLSFDDGEIRSCTYEETESYQVTKMFLMHREKMLEGMLGE